MVYHAKHDVGAALPLNPWAASLTPGTVWRGCRGCWSEIEVPVAGGGGGDGGGNGSAPTEETQHVVRGTAVREDVIVLDVSGAPKRSESQQCLSSSCADGPHVENASACDGFHGIWDQEWAVFCRHALRRLCWEGEENPRGASLRQPGTALAPLTQLYAMSPA